jgi:transposase
VKAERALEVAEAVLSGPVADRPNWTLPRLAEEIERRSGLRISRSRLSVVLRKKGVSAGGALGTR